MFALSYKTAGDSPSRGKPRVYLCCHPDEQKTYLEPISKEVLSKQTCAIWYAQDPHAPRDEAFWSDLEQMQLLLLPVTTRLLTTENIALEEFRFAIAHHIPVLPLMQEPGLTELFNRVCGDLQSLEKNDADVTAISYDEKLKNYLSAVLLGDELVKKIRAAFDAYIFLSYRKKDRRHAQELMRLIHQNEFCRDIAIWYDEFLTPGENFNDAIRSALEKSHLFVLTVTPNLVSETNYIMTTEYPMAKEAGKPILPAELIPTDRAQLSEKYESIPDCTDAHDAAALTKALLHHLHSLAISENSDPIHTYFIGLAYLSGIDVEVDHARALGLITSAAEKGLPEAITKLAEMYRTGLGVPRDHKAAIVWEEKRLALLEKQFKATPNIFTLPALFNELLTCGDYYMEVGEQAQAKRLYDTARKLAEKNAAAHITVRHLLPFSYHALGKVCHAQGDLAAAKDYFARALSLREALMEEGDIDLRQELAASCVHLGDLCCDEGDLTGAKEYYDRSIAIWEASDDNIDVRHNLSLCCRRLGNLCRFEGKLSAAKVHYERSLSLCEGVFAESGSEEDERTILLLCTDLGNTCLDRHRRRAAEKYYKRSLAIAEALEKETDTIQARRDLSIVCGKLGKLFSLRRRHAVAEDYYRRSLSIDEALAEETGTLQARRDLMLSCNRMGTVCEAKKDLPGAREYYRRSLSMCRQILEKTQTLQAREDLALVYFYLAMAGDENKLAYLHSSVEIYEALHRASPRIKRYETNLMAIGIELERALRKEKRALSRRK